jgi:predicted amidohydrolase
MKLALAQLDSAWEDKPRNFARVRELARAAGTADWLILPEMFATGFSMNEAATVEPADGATVQYLTALAAEFQLGVVGTLIERGPGGACNTALVIDRSGRIRGRYAKVHPFRYALEDRHYAAGDGPVEIEVDGVKLAPFICYDLRFPELFRVASARGAELLVVVANWPASRIEHWTALLRARAIECQAFVAGVNRCGSGGGLGYPGRSTVIDPLGEVLWQSGDQESVDLVDIDLARVSQARESMAFLADMRAELYARLYQQLKA